MPKPSNLSRNGSSSTTNWSRRKKSSILDFTEVAQKRNELKSRAEKWPTKKKVVYHKAFMASYLKACNDIKKQIKEGKIDWSDPEPNVEDEGENRLDRDFLARRRARSLRQRTWSRGSIWADRSTSIPDLTWTARRRATGLFFWGNDCFARWWRQAKPQGVANGGG